MKKYLIIIGLFVTTIVMAQEKVGDTIYFDFQDVRGLKNMEFINEPNPTDEIYVFSNYPSTVRFYVKKNGGNEFKMRIKDFGKKSKKLFTASDIDQMGMKKIPVQKWDHKGTKLFIVDKCGRKLRFREAKMVYVGLIEI